MAHKLQEAGSQAAERQQQLSTDAPVAQNSNRVELLGLSMGQQGWRKEERGREAAPTVRLLCCL